MTQTLISSISFSIISIFFFRYFQFQIFINMLIFFLLLMSLFVSKLMKKSNWVFDFLYLVHDLLLFLYDLLL